MNALRLAALMVLLTATAALAAGVVPPYLGSGITPAPGRQMSGTPHVSAAQVTDVGLLRLDSGFDYGSGIGFNGENTQDFDSLRFLIGAGYGYMDNLEVGGRLGYESNSGKFGSVAPVFGGAGNTASNSLSLEDNGLEYLQAYAKYQYSPQIAMEASIAFAGDNKIYHGMDGVDFGIKGIFSSDMGIGTMHAELGYLMKSGEHDLGGNPSRYNQQTTGYENILIYGVGLEYPYLHNLTFIGEIHGWSSPFDKWSETSQAPGGDNFLALNLGAKYQMTSDLSLNGTLGVGLSDGAPDFSLYAGITKMFDMGGSRRGGTPTAYNAPAGPPSAYPPPSLNAPPAYTPPPTVPQVSPQEQARQAVERGNAAFSARDYNTSAAAYREATTYDPQNQLAFFNLGVSYYSLGRYSEAVAAYQSAARINPSDVDANLWLGMAYYQLGDSPKAISSWQRVLQLDPNNQTAQNNLKALGAY